MTRPQLRSRHSATRSTRRALLWSLLGLATFASRAIHAESVPPLRILIHPENPLTSLNKDFVIDVFLKRTTRWHDGETAHPVDQRSDATVRKEFSDSILR